MEDLNNLILVFYLILRFGFRFFFILFYTFFFFEIIYFNYFKKIFIRLNLEIVFRLKK